MVEDREFEGSSEEEYWEGLDKYLRSQMWRPDDWHKIVHTGVVGVSHTEEYFKGVEDGANKILGALIHYKTAEMWQDKESWYCLVSFPVRTPEEG